MKLVLFDCDGTLVDSVANIHGCMERSFSEAGLALPTLAQTKRVIGLSLDLAIAQILQREPDQQTKQLAARYKEHFVAMRSEPGFSEPLYDGVGELIEELASYDEIVLGIVTGKSRRGVNSVLTTHGWSRLFHTVRTADDCPSKPHPAMVVECCTEAGIDPSQSLVVGDAVYDMQMARAAQSRGIGVSWGYHAEGDLREAGAHEIADDARHLLELVLEDRI